MPRILIACYSWSGNTRALAEAIQQQTGGDRFEILPVEAYPADYNAVVNQAKREIADGHLPALQALPDNLDRYDTVFVGTPNWWSTIAPPVAGFLSAVDLSGKTVLPFCTHGGGGQARCATDTAALCPGAVVLDGFAAYGDGRRDAPDLTAWLRQVGAAG